MKKINQFIILFLIFILTLSFNWSYAHSVELDPENLITFPMFAMGGKGTISVSNSISNYTLYYQAVEIPNSDFEKIEKIENDGKDELADIKKEYEKLKTEADSLMEIAQKAKEDYEQGVNDKLQEAELESLKAEYDTALANYESKIGEYREKVASYNDKIKEINDNENELVPTYIESNWKETTDKTFAIDLTQFSGKKAFAIWVKLVTSDGTTYYDEGTYTMNGSKTEENNNQTPGNSSTGSGSSSNQNQDGVDGTLVKSSTLPKAGVTYTVLFAIVVFAVLGFVLYRKDKDLKLK